MVLKNRFNARSIVGDAPDEVGDPVEVAVAHARSILALLLAGPEGAPSAAVPRHFSRPGEARTRLNIVPGLLAVILTMTMVMMTALAVTRERERGTMENLLAMPVKPLEVMIGKIVPYIVIGSVQAVVILSAARLLFDVRVEGSVALLCLATALFITVNLALGFTISTVTQNQLQAMQMSVFVLLPSILLSGFMFPFRGMPEWAQWLGACLPLTHFLRIVRGILLKGSGPLEIAPELWPLLAFLAVAMAVGVKRYRQTLD